MRECTLSKYLLNGYGMLSILIDYVIRFSICYCIFFCFPPYILIFVLEDNAHNNVQYNSICLGQLSIRMIPNKIHYRLKLNKNQAKIGNIIFSIELMYSTVIKIFDIVVILELFFAIISMILKHIFPLFF